MYFWNDPIWKQVTKLNRDIGALRHRRRSLSWYFPSYLYQSNISLKYSLHLRSSSNPLYLTLQWFQVLKRYFIKPLVQKYKYLREVVDKNIVSLVIKETKTKEISLNNIYLSLQNWLYSTNFANSNKKDSELMKQSQVCTQCCSFMFDQFCHVSVMPSLRWQAKVRSLSPTDSQTHPRNSWACQLIITFLLP